MLLLFLGCLLEPLACFLKIAIPSPSPQTDKIGIPKGGTQVKTFHESFPADSKEPPGWTSVSLQERRDQVGEGATSAEMLMPGTGSLPSMVQGPGRS